MEVTRIVAKAHSLTISAGLILSATCHQQSAKLPSLRISASNRCTKNSSVFPAFVLLVSKVVLIFDPLGGKPQAVLIFGAVLSLGPVLIFGTGV